MTRRQKFDYWIEQVKTGEIDRAGLLNFLEEMKPKPYQSMAKRNCVCGAKARSNVYEWYNTKTRMLFLECDKCGRKGKEGSNYLEALRNWNNMIDDES